MNNYPKKVYLNGEFLDYQNAKISVFDRGFLFGDGIYEVMVQVNGCFFYKEEHLKRLADCLQKISIYFEINTILEKINKLLKVSDLEGKDCLLYIQITRGIAPRKHKYPNKVNPTLMMYALPFTLPDINEDHISVIAIHDQRWHRCDIKTTSLLSNVMANDCASKKEANEAIFIREGRVTEASHCNIFFVKDAIVYTHPADEFILNGITRQQVISLCVDLDLEIREMAINQEQILNMDEAFLTGTTTQVASIRQIDDHFFYQNEETGPITKKLQKAFLELKNKTVNTL
jgi:D-alanine transaminase